MVSNNCRTLQRAVRSLGKSEAFDIAGKMGKVHFALLDEVWVSGVPGAIKRTSIRIGCSDSLVSAAGKMLVNKFVDEGVKPIEYTPPPPARDKRAYWRAYYWERKAMKAMRDGGDRSWEPDEIMKLRKELQDRINEVDEWLGRVRSYDCKHVQLDENTNGRKWEER